MIVKEALLSLFAMLKGGAVALVRHWPMLLLLFFLGKGLSAGLLWVAIAGSKLSPLLGMLLLPGAPIAMLIAMVLMLRTVVPSLPALTGEPVQGPRREVIRRDLVLAVQVLIPFLAVYASQGMMREDVRTYIFSGAQDEWLNKGFAADFARVTFGTEAQILAIVIIALVLRKTIAGFDLASRHLGIAGVAGYLEALWLVTLGAYFTTSLADVREWVMGRAVIGWVGAFKDWLFETLGPIGTFMEFLTTKFSSVAGEMGALVVVPVAWIAVGATIYGASLPGSEPLLTHEEMTKRIKQIPGPLRRAAAQVAEPVMGPVRNTIVAIKRVAVAGIVPMVFLCLILAIASQVRVITAMIIRQVIGPRGPGFWEAFSPHIDLFAQAVYITAMVVLIAAAVNEVVKSQERLKEQESAREASAE